MKSKATTLKTPVVYTIETMSHSQSDTVMNIETQLEADDGRSSRRVCPDLCVQSCFHVLFGRRSVTKRARDVKRKLGDCGRIRRPHCRCRASYRARSHAVETVEASVGKLWVGTSSERARWRAKEKLRQRKGRQNAGLGG